MEVTQIDHEDGSITISKTLTKIEKEILEFDINGILAWEENTTYQKIRKLIEGNNSKQGIIELALNGHSRCELKNKDKEVIQKDLPYGVPIKMLTKNQKDTILKKIKIKPIGKDI